MFAAKKKATPPRTIGLLTDFGLSDPYVGQMKAVLARKAPACPVVDITHDVAPFNVAQAGFFLTASYAHFAKDSIILAVVDPGVGSKRRIVGLQLDGRLLIAPDNGLLSLPLKNANATEIRAFDFSMAMDAPDSVSKTFHGRDVFAPLAAWLALGGDPQGLGGEIDPASLVTASWSTPDVSPGVARAHVLHIDRFGNCALNLRADHLDHPQQLELTTPEGGALAYATTYSDMPEGAACLLEGSQGVLEIAVNQGSAAKRFGLSMGDAVELKWEA